MNKTESILSAPPIAIAGASVLGFSLPEWAAIVTIVYTLILIYFRIRKEIGKHNNQQRRHGEVDGDD